MIDFQQAWLQFLVLLYFLATSQRKHKGNLKRLPKEKNDKKKKICSFTDDVFCFINIVNKCSARKDE